MCGSFAYLPFSLIIELAGESTFHVTGGGRNNLVLNNVEDPSPLF